MRFYSGFSLRNEISFFERFITYSDFCVAGFSYGAIRAFEIAYDDIKNSKRVDTLQLFSPAFFQTLDKKFHKLQMLGYMKNKESYLDEFLTTCFLPLDICKVERIETTKEQLVELLEYEWIVDKFVFLQNAGVKIEVYLGGNDKVIDVNNAKEFFLQVADVSYIKGANHFLQEPYNKFEGFR